MSEVVYGVGQQVEIATDLGEGGESQAELGGQGWARPATQGGAAAGGGGPERATHFDAPDHGAQAGFCSRRGQIAASIELGSSSGVFAGGLGPGEGGRGDIRCPPLGQGRCGEAGGNTAFVWLDSAVPSAGCPRTQQAVHLPRGCHYQAMKTWQGLVPSLPEPPQQAGPASQSSQEKAKRPLSGFNSELGPPGPGTTTQEAKVSRSWGLGLTWLVLSVSLLSRNIFSKARKVRKPAMTHSPSCCCCCRLCPSPPAGGGADRPGQARPGP